MNKGTGFILFVLVSHMMYSQKDPLFELVPPALSGVNFKNILEESPTANVLTYEYFYNGGGVAIGDINNEGLEEIYFLAKMKTKALYFNMGNFKFKEITEPAGCVFGERCRKGGERGT